MLSKLNIKESIAPIIYGEKEVKKIRSRICYSVQRGVLTLIPLSFFYFLHTFVLGFGSGLRIL